MAIAFGNSLVPAANTSDTTIYDNSAGSGPVLIFSLVASNTTSPSATATVNAAIVNGAARTSLITNGEVPAKSSLCIVDNKNKVILKVGDRLVANAGASSTISLAASYVSGLS